MRVARIIATTFRMVSDFRDRQPEASPSACLERQLPFECELICRIAAAVPTKIDKSEQMGVTFPPTIRACLAHARITAASADTSPASRCTCLPRFLAS
ncbi:hypothetical protein G3O06_02400 [Burkholderia sp. Ac-20345]|uniref:hypothetical protein n=1 Tax=Burkholderia sp. Ac-20345 TaxID=2703891 RepID=UPI00197C0CCD|nr:hypothetical protein [Burkholderia sp. Ac-20345]MBN3776414.1 hypothetical protein [Burkholderia sp. Ac-20345]